MSSTFSGEGRHRALASVTGRAIKFSRLPSPPARLGSPVTLPRQRVLSWMTIRVGAAVKLFRFFHGEFVLSIVFCVTRIFCMHAVMTTLLGLPCSLSL